jgi:peptide/nickel transport system substrate-binding protein
MSDQLDLMIARVRRGMMSRREFVGRTAAMGLSAGLAGAIFTKAAHAEEAKKGGVLRMGVTGGESTNTLDPALSASPNPYVIANTWGEALVSVDSAGALEMRLAEEVSSNAEATEWKFKVRAGVEFHGGGTMTAEDVVATLKRHTDEKSQSGALGIVRGISEMTAEGDMVTLKLASANADLPFLMADYHLIVQPGGGVDNPAAGNGTGAYKITSFEPGVIATFERNANYWDSSTTIPHGLRRSSRVRST